MENPTTARSRVSEQFFQRLKTMTAVIEPRKADSAPRPREVFRRWLVTKHYSPRTVDCYVNRLLDFARHFRRSPVERRIKSPLDA